MAKWQCPDQWTEWSEWLAAGLDARNRWRLPLVLMGLLFARGRRTVSSWLRAAGISDDYQDYYYFIGMVGRKTKELAGRVVVLIVVRLPLDDRVVGALDDSPTKRYGPKVEGAGIHHNPTPGPADQKYLYGHVWVTLSILAKHPLWGTIGLPVLASMYVRLKNIGALASLYGWEFRTKLELGVSQVLWLANLLKHAGKTLWIVADGAYANRPFLKPLRDAGVVVVSRLRKNAALRDLPPKPKKGARPPRGRRRKYGRNKISLAKRAAHSRGWQTCECFVYGQRVLKTYKTFLATYVPAAGVIRVVIVKEPQGCEYFFCTDPQASAAEIIETFADRAAIENNFHDVKEVWGAGQQQVRTIWANIGAYNLNLWMHTLVELWAWNKPHQELTDRSASPWDDPERRPSHADRRKALQQECLQQEFSNITGKLRLPRKVRDFIKRLRTMAS
jgi:hypothetical protein